MRNLVRLANIRLLATISITLVAISMVASTAAHGATALIVPGTGTTDPSAVPRFEENARDNYLGATPCASTASIACTLAPVRYPAALWPLTGFQSAKYADSVNDGVGNLNSALISALQEPDEPIVVFGVSQGANVASDELEIFRNLDPELKKRLTFVVAGNTNRPAGGIWTRLGPLGHIPVVDVDLGRPTPNDIGIVTQDIAFEYDFVADAPAYLFNPLSMANSVLGLVYIHPTYMAPNGNTKPDLYPDEYTPDELRDQLDPAKHPENFRYYGDTTYITIPTKTLPIVRPALGLAARTGTTPIVEPIVAAVSPVLRTIIDTGYDRKSNPGVYSPFRLFPRINPAEFAGDLVDAAAQGVDDAGSVAAAQRRSRSAPVTAATTAPRTGVAALPALPRWKSGNLFRPGTQASAQKSNGADSTPSASTDSPASSATDTSGTAGGVTSRLHFLPSSAPASATS